MISLYFNITPKAKQSFRMGKHNYQSMTVRKYAEDIRKMALAQIPKARRNTEAMLFVSVEFVWHWPKAWSAKRIEEEKQHCSYRAARPDIDNLCKGIFDPLNGIAWKDDGQVVALHAWKRYGDADCVIMRIWDASEKLLDRNPVFD